MLEADEAGAPRAVAQRDARRRDALDFPGCKAANDNAPAHGRTTPFRFPFDSFRADSSTAVFAATRTLSWNVHSSIWSNS
jgi:hypothetical protein